MKLLERVTNGKEEKGKKIREGGIIWKFMKKKTKW